MAASAVTRRRSIMPRQARGRRLRREMSSRDARALALVGPPLLHARLLLQAKPFEECVDQSRPDLARAGLWKGLRAWRLDLRVEPSVLRRLGRGGWNRPGEGGDGTSSTRCFPSATFLCRSASIPG